MEDIFERDSIFSFPRSWKKGKKHVEDSAVGLMIEEPVAKAKQPYSLERIRAHELALDWFEEDFDDSDDDGERIVDSDSDNDNDINDTNKVLDDLTRSRIEAQKIKSSIVVDQGLVSESRTRQRESLAMSREDYNILKLKTLNTKTSHKESNNDSKKNEKNRLTVKSVNIGVGATIKEGDNKKLHPARKSSESIAGPQIISSSSSVPVAYIPFTYTAPTINNLIKPETDLKKVLHTYHHHHY